MSPRNRIWLLIAVVAGIGVVAFGYLLGIAPKIEEAKVADAARAEAASTNALYERQLAKLKKDFEGIEDIQAQLDKLGVQLPAETDYETYLDLVNSAAAASGVGPSDFSWGVPELITTDSASLIAAAAAAAANGEDAAPVEAEVTGVAPDGGLVALPWSITVSGKIDSLRAFVFMLQRTDRLFLVTGYTINKSTGENAPADEYDLALSGSTFVLVNSKAVERLQAETPTPTPEPTETPVPSDTPTGTPTPPGSATPAP